ncbi:MAG: protein kinase [Acidobacteriota bacterium]|nr:protein kinase [Acidobacteriota bacterium]
MTLVPGTKLGPYEILSPLGAGGMGEVYRARDPRLGRDVAVKVLPEEFFEGEERRQRFQREARLLAALNHPGIAGIYSFEEIPSSSSSSSRHILVMELVEGCGLDQRIASGPLPLEEILSFSIQIAEALSAAHEKGITHRDLKPANVRVTPAGRVKLLDFGLARTSDTHGGTVETEETLAKLTQAGTIVGTIPYMSPEQVEARPLDHRSDLFSLGVVLYEMATGGRPFSGGSPPALMSSILRDDPSPLSNRRPGLPDGLSRLVARCLEKRPGDRIQTASEILADLKALSRAQEGYRSSGSSAAAQSGAARGEEGFWVAVLPFKYSGSNADVVALAEGLSEEIVTGLSRFSYLRVIARGATSLLANGAADVRTVASEIGARYVMEGSLRQAGSTLRVAAQLTDATTGAHLWAETYDRPFSADDVFALQDDVVPRIVSTCADSFGVLARSISDAVREKDSAELTPYEALMRFFGYHHRLTPVGHAEAREALERAVQRAPANADCWAVLSWVYSHEHAHGFNARPGSLDRALAAARRAVDLAPSSHLAHQALAVVLFFRKEPAGSKSAAERAIALNPLDGSNEAIFLVTFLGDWEGGCALIRRAMERNPHHPGWYRLVLGFNEYRKGSYREALDEAVKANAPDIFWTHVMLAAVHGQLGDLAAAGNALNNLLAQREDFAQTGEALMGKWFDSRLVEHFMDGLRKAGLDLPSSARVPWPPPVRDSAVAIAVLPFADMSAAKDQEYLCEGMAEEIMHALVRVDGIRVASRTSAFQARRQGADLSAIGRLLSVGHVLEGSVRTAGDRLRVTAQLTDVSSGFQQWSERFDRKAEDVFAVQDEIAMGVVDAVKSRLSSGEHAFPARPQPTNLEAYRSYLKGRHLRGKEHPMGAICAFEEAVRLDPSHAPSWTGLAESTVLASVFGLIPARDACATARRALATATRLQGESAEGLHVEAFVAWIERRWEAMEAAWRRAIELQPTHVLALASFGLVLCTRRRLDEALPFLERGRQADPLSSFPYTLTGSGFLGCGRPQEALRYLEDALSFEKEDATALDNAGMAMVVLGRHEEGIAMLEHVVAISHRGAHFLGTLGWALAIAGRKGDARTILEELRARPPAAPAVVSEAWLLGALGEVDAAFEVVARAEEECLAYLYFTGLPGFDPLRGDARFAALEERLGLAA